MASVTIVIFDGVLAASAAAMNELLYVAGRSSTAAEGPGLFDIRLASWDGQPVSTVNELMLMPHCAIDAIEASDVWLVPTIAGDMRQSLDANRDLIAFLAAVGQSSSIVGSNSSGAFFLAEAGLLDGRQATCHHSGEAFFRERYPKVDLQCQRRLVHDGNVLTDCGGLAWFDMGLYLIELFGGRDVASATAGYFMVDSERSGQLTFAPTGSRKLHKDDVVRDLQDWMDSELASNISLEQLAERGGVSSRSLIRRFRQATGATPINYLQDLRLDAASRLLLQSSDSIEQIAVAVGYRDVSSFTRLFKRRTGLSPGNYRARFRVTG